MTVAKRETQDLVDFADALREALGLAPLGGERQIRPDAERFYASHELPVRAKGTGIGGRF